MISMRNMICLGILMMLAILGCRHKNVHTNQTKKEEKSQATILSTGNYERYLLHPQLIQTLPEAGDLNWGGFSGLHFIEKELTGDLIFWTITDRGPNGLESKKDKVIYRPFLMPSFHPSLVKIKTNKADKVLEVIESIPLKNSTGEFLTGLPPANSEDSPNRFEIPVDTNMNRISAQGLGIDTESLAIDSQQHFWVGEEYDPSILEFDPQGTLISHIQPAEKANVKLRKNELPYDYRFRKSNRGFEALSYFKDRIYFMTQSPLAFETKPRFIRIGVFNTKTRFYEAEYLFSLDIESADKIGDMQMLNSKQFMVILQNGEIGPSSIHSVFKVDLAQATNVLKSKFSKAPELLSQKSFPKKFKFAKKRLVVDLVKDGYAEFEKVEGLAIIDDKTIAVINDNDFGVEGGRITPKPTALGVFKILNELQ